MDGSMGAIVGASILGAGVGLFAIARARRASIRRQIFVALVATTLALSAIFGAIVVERFHARSIAFAHRAALDDAHVVADLTARSMEVLDLSLRQGAHILQEERVLYGFTDGPGETRVQLIDRSGRVIFDTLRGRTERRDLRAEPDVAAALAGAIDPHPREIEPGIVVASAPITVHGEVVGVARVQRSAVAMAQLADDLAPEVAMLALLLTALAALAAWAIGRSVAGPVERLTRAARAIAKGKRQARLPEPRGAEVRALTQAFETMRSSLEERDAIEELAADLSHEIKNPVAAIRAAAEIVEDAAEDDPVAVRRFARNIVESAERLDAITGDLLVLARLEAKGIARAPIDPSAIAAEAIDACAPRADRKEVQIDLDAERVDATGDAAWLRRAIENLVSNAVDFAPDGSRVRVRVAVEGSDVEIAVRDEGPGVSPEMRDRLLERFATSRGDDGGTGLGLALVRSVAEAHGGRVELREIEGPGAEFALIVPRA